MPDGSGELWRLTSFGARIALAGADEALRDDLAAGLPGSSIERVDGPGAAPRPDVAYRFVPLAGDGGWSLLRGRSELARGGPAPVLARALDALHFDVALHAREASFVHASAVAWQGRLLLFPGRTGAGKSTIAAFLAARGGTYWSDEYAPIDDGGRVLPYAKAISLRPDVAPRYPVTGGGGSDLAAGAPHAVVFTRFRPAARFRPRPMTVEAAALSLVDNSVAAVPSPRRSAAAVARLLAHRPRLGRGTRGEVEQFAEELDRWLAGGG